MSEQREQWERSSTEGGTSYQPRVPQGIDLICPECGELLHVADPVQMVRTLHALNECSIRTLYAPRE